MGRNHVWILVAVISALLVTGLSVFGLGFGESEPVVPELNEPIEAVDGGFYLDGGSVSVRLRGSNGVELPIMYTQDCFPNDSYLPNRVYIGSMDEVSSGKGALVPRGGPAAAKLVGYLASAVEEHDPDFVAGKTGYVSVWNETQAQSCSARDLRIKDRGSAVDSWTCASMFFRACCGAWRTRNVKKCVNRMSSG